jgi:hypothetical protein
MKQNDKKAKIRLPKLYKRLLLIAIVVGPMWWLVFTEDGQRRSDMFILKLFGNEPFYLNLKELDDRFTEKEMYQLYPELTWKCKDEHTSFGDRYCVSQIGSFNDLPADHATLFFSKFGINAVKINYRHNYHGVLGKDLRYQLGNPLPETDAAKGIPSRDRIVHWRTNGGHVITKQTLNKGEEPALLWLSSAQMASKGDASE